MSCDISHRRKPGRDAATTPERLLEGDAAVRASAVRAMFTSIAPHYDLLNHLLSFQVDRLWWRRAARTFSAVLGGNARVLDLCCGTGDMTFSLCRQARSGGAAPQVSMFGVDFSHAMLTRARAKSGSARHAGDAGAIRWIEADALRLPFADGSFALVTSAFGFRNLADYDAGLREIYRVLAPEGQLGILDFGEPRGAIGQVYRLYFRHVLPAVGTLLSGVRGPYAYLPASVRRFPPPNQMLERLRAAGFRQASWTPYTFGVAGLYRATK